MSFRTRHILMELQITKLLNDYLLSNKLFVQNETDIVLFVRLYLFWLTMLMKLIKNTST